MHRTAGQKESFAEKFAFAAVPPRILEAYLRLLRRRRATSCSRYPDFEKDTLWAETYVRPCNYVNNLENDPIYIPFTHRESEFYMNRPPEIRISRSRRAIGACY